MAINSFVIIIYNSFDFPEEKYDNFYTVLYIILYFIILYNSVGSIALFSQQIYFLIDLKNILMLYLMIKIKIKINHIFHIYVSLQFLPILFTLD